MPFAMAMYQGGRGRVLEGRRGQVSGGHAGCQGGCGRVSGGRDWVSGGAVASCWGGCGRESGGPWPGVGGAVAGCGGPCQLCGPPQAQRGLHGNRLRVSVATAGRSQEAAQEGRPQLRGGSRGPARLSRRQTLCLSSRPVAGLRLLPPAPPPCRPVWGPAVWARGCRGCLARIGCPVLREASPVPPPPEGSCRSGRAVLSVCLCLCVLGGAPRPPSCGPGASAQQPGKGAESRPPPAPHACPFCCPSLVTGSFRGPGTWGTTWAGGGSVFLGTQGPTPPHSLAVSICSASSSVPADGEQTDPSPGHRRTVPLWGRGVRRCSSGRRWGARCGMCSAGVGKGRAVGPPACGFAR